MTSINHHFATWNVCYSSIFTLQIIYVGFIKEKDKCYYRSILQKKCNDKFKLIIEKKTLINENVLWKYLSLSKYHQFRLHLKQIIFNENRYSLQWHELYFCVNEKQMFWHETIFTGSMFFCFSHPIKTLGWVLSYWL